MLALWGFVARRDNRAGPPSRACAWHELVVGVGSFHHAALAAWWPGLGPGGPGERRSAVALGWRLPAA
jgi:hypothetical protein